MIILLSSSVVGINQAQADTTVKLKHLGFLQLAAHDLFDVDRCDGIDPTCAHDFENGRLDLSTLLINMRGGKVPFSDGQIMMGGEPRNAENVMLFTVASQLGIKYVTERDACLALNNPNLDCENIARDSVLSDYYTELDEAYFAAFGESTPAPGYGCTTMTENLALRTIHDFLPDHIEFMGNPSTFIFDIPFLATLSVSELDQDSSPLDGIFDDAFMGMTFIPALGTTLDLLEKDESFAVQFSTLFSFGFFLDELGPFGNFAYDADDEVMNQIRNLFAKGYGDGCYIVGGQMTNIDSVSLLLNGAQSTSWLIPIGLSAAGIGFVIAKRKF